MEINIMQGKVMLFNFTEEEQLQAVKMAAFLSQISVLEIPKEKFGMPIGMLLEEETAASPMGNAGQKFDGQMIVFAGLPEEKLDGILALLRANPACGRIPYKAVLTETNRDWNAYALLGELQKEHALMSRSGKNSR